MFRWTETALEPTIQFCLNHRNDGKTVNKGVAKRPLFVGCKPKSRYTLFRVCHICFRVYDVYVEFCARLCWACCWFEFSYFQWNPYTFQRDFRFELIVSNALRKNRASAPGGTHDPSTTLGDHFMCGKFPCLPFTFSAFAPLSLLHRNVFLCRAHRRSALLALRIGSPLRERAWPTHRRIILCRCVFLSYFSLKMTVCSVTGGV